MERSGKPEPAPSRIAWTGRFGLPSIRRADINGIPVFWAPVPGPSQVSLMFGVGRAHEPLARSGACHLVRHLALSALQPPDCLPGGYVDAISTTFSAQGTPAQTANFLRRITATLAELPVERVPVERDVVRAQPAQRWSEAESYVTASRFGLSGFGVLTYDEIGLHCLDEEYVGRWCREHFCADNAVIWMTGPPPAGLSLALPRGRPTGWPARPPYPVVTPATYHAAGKGGVAFSGLVEPSPAVPSLVWIARSRINTAVKERGEWSYETDHDFYLIDSKTALIWLSVGCAPRRAPEAASVMRGVLEGLAAGGITAAEFERYRSACEPFFAQPDAMVVLLRRIARQSLGVGEVWDRTDPMFEGQHGVDLRDSIELMRQALETAIWVAPDEFGADLHDYSPWADDPVEGVHLRSIASAPNDNPLELIVGSGGITLIRTDHTWRTVRFARCAAVQRWDDGRVLMVGDNGLGLALVPWAWERGYAAVTAIEKNVPADRWVHMSASDLDDD